MPSSQWGVFEWGDAEWGVAEAEAVGTRTPAAAALSLTAFTPTLALSNLSLTIPTATLVLLGTPPAPGETRPLTAGLILSGLAPTLEVSGENMLGFEWAVLHPADILLGFQWTVLPQVVTGATLELTWTVIGEPPPLGLTWTVIPAELFDLFESAGVGAAAGIGEDILLPVGRVTRA